MALLERLVGIFAAAHALERIAARHESAAQIAGFAGGAAELVKAIEVRLELVVSDAPILDRHVIGNDAEVRRQEAPVMTGPMQAGAADALAWRERAPAPHRQRALIREMPEGDGFDGIVGDELGAAPIAQFVADRRQHEIVARHAIGSALEPDHGQARLGQFASEDRAGQPMPTMTASTSFKRVAMTGFLFNDWLPFQSIHSDQSSATKPDAFTTGPQRSMSAFTLAVNCSGVWKSGSLANFARFSATSGDFDASATAALNALTTAAGVRAGTNRPIHESMTTS
jgi:hypothetical protein